MCGTPGARWYSVTTLIPKPSMSLMASLTLEQRGRLARQANKADDRRAQKEQDQQQEEQKQQQEAAKELANKKPKPTKALADAGKANSVSSEGVIMSLWHWLDNKCAF
jgi:biotin carboxyl carrier protein